MYPRHVLFKHQNSFTPGRTGLTEIKRHNTPTGIFLEKCRVTFHLWEAPFDSWNQTLGNSKTCIFKKMVEIENIRGISRNEQASNNLSFVRRDGELIPSYYHSNLNPKIIKVPINISVQYIYPSPFTSLSFNNLCHSPFDHKFLHIQCNVIKLAQRGLVLPSTT